jgi:Icc-related predicted phosphoesterase
MFGRRPKARVLRVFFATDVHGSDRCFRKFLAAAGIYSADVLILGGDIAGKGLVPIKASNGTLTASFHGEAVSVPRSDESRLRDDFNRFGFYSVVVDDAEHERLNADSSYVDQLFKREIKAQVQRWCELAAERLPRSTRCIITPGNDDPPFVDGVLKQAPKIESPEAQLCEMGPVLLASLGDVTPTPWNTDREYSEEELAARIDRLLSDPPTGHKVVLNFHCPPYDSGLDLAPELDGNLRPVIRNGQPSLIPVGSVAVRDAILKYAPVVGLHGHIHEGRGAHQVGSTMCLNPGSEYSADLLRGAIVDFASDGSYVDFLLTAG